MKKPALSSIVLLVLEVRERGNGLRTRLGSRGRRAVVIMTGSGPKLGVLLLVAVLLQTVVVTITVLHFTTALNSVRNPCARSGDADRGVWFYAAAAGGSLRSAKRANRLKHC